VHDGSEVMMMSDERIFVRIDSSDLESYRSGGMSTVDLPRPTVDSVTCSGSHQAVIPYGIFPF
jgi:hypothetical protein